MTNSLTMTGVMADDIGESAIASFRPKKSGEQVVSVSGGADESANNALLGLPAVLEAYDDLAGFMTAMGVFCATEKKLDLKSWVSAVVKDHTLNVQMQAVEKSKRIAFMIEIATAEAKLLAE